MDGLRILVDRLWPRGPSKGVARIDLWLKEKTLTLVYGANDEHHNNAVVLKEYFGSG